MQLKALVGLPGVVMSAVLAFLPLNASAIAETDQTPGTSANIHAFSGCRQISRGPASGARKALIIGTSAYTFAGNVLTNPTNDADDISDSLIELGFQVTECRDASLDEMDEHGYAAFVEGLKPKDWAFVYYAGHGVQSADQEIYMLPSDFKTVHESSLPRKAIPVYKFINDIKMHLAVPILFFDACRENPFTSNADGAARISNFRTVDDAILFLSASAGEVALDGKAGPDGKPDRNSIFARAVMEQLKGSNQQIDQFMSNVTETVKSETNKRQHPRFQNDAGPRFSFRSVDPSGAELAATSTGLVSTASAAPAAPAPISSAPEKPIVVASNVTAGSPASVTPASSSSPTATIDASAAPSGETRSYTLPNSGGEAKTVASSDGRSQSSPSVSLPQAAPNAAGSGPANATNPIVVAFLTSGKLPPEPTLDPVAEPKVPSTFCKIEDQNEMLSLNKAAQIKANDNYIKAKDYEALLTSLATQANQAGTALANQAGRRWDEYAPTMRLWKATSERLYTQNTIIRSSPVKPCSK